MKAPPALSEGSKIDAILNKARQRPDLVVKRARRRIARTCVPVDSARPRSLGVCADAIDQGSRHTSAPRSFRSEHVLQIAYRKKLRRRTMKQVVREPDQRMSFFSDKRMDRFEFVEEAPPRQLRHLLGNLPGTSLITAPKRFPARSVRRLHGSYAESRPSVMAGHPLRHTLATHR